MPVIIKIEGIDNLIKKLGPLEGLRCIKPPIKASALHIKGKVDQYPAASEANTPGDHWYERGYGSRWQRKDGSFGGKRSSETLGRKWTIAEVNGGLGAIIGNNVSYGPFVQDEDKQASFHGARDWPTIQKVTKDEADYVTRIIKDAVDAILEAGPDQ